MSDNDAARALFDAADKIQHRPLSEAQWIDSVEFYQRVKVQTDALNDLIKAFAEQTGKTAAQIRKVIKALADSREDEMRDELRVMADDEILMPRRLTSKNGAKAALIGEFSVSSVQSCPSCQGCDSDDCPRCDGEGVVPSSILVSWTTIKAIYAAAVEHFHPEPTKCETRMSK